MIVMTTNEHQNETELTAFLGQLRSHKKKIAWMGGPMCEILGKTAIPCGQNTLKAAEFWARTPGFGRIRVGNETLTVPRLGGILVGPFALRQIFNDSDAEVLWLVVGAPEKEFEPHEVGDMSLIYPVAPTQLPPELSGSQWPPKA